MQKLVNDLANQIKEKLTNIYYLIKLNKMVRLKLQYKKRV